MIRQRRRRGGGCVQELRALVYPLVQVLLGAARLVPAPRYFPLRLRIAAALQRLADSAGVLVPLAPLLLEMLTWADLAKPPQVRLPWDRLAFLSRFDTNETQRYHASNYCTSILIRSPFFTSLEWMDPQSTSLRAPSSCGRLSVVTSHLALSDSV